MLIVWMPEWRSYQQGYMRPLLTTTLALNIASWNITENGVYSISAGLIFSMMI